MKTPYTMLSGIKFKALELIDVNDFGPKPMSAYDPKRTFMY